MSEPAAPARDSAASVRAELERIRAALERADAALAALEEPGRERAPRERARPERYLRVLVDVY